MEGEALNARLAGWLERAFNPILVKELRGNLRGAKFFAVHMTVLGLFAAGLLLLLAVNMFSGSQGHEGGVDPARVGREAFTWIQLLHLLVVFLVVPGFAATSLTSEREGLTFDLLQSTALDAQSIVWGKLVAAMAQTLTIFVSMAPLVALTFLFGGVTFYQIAASYTFLVALSILMSAFAISVSAGVKSSQRSVTTVYGGSLFAGLAAACLGVVLFSGSTGAHFALAYGFVSEGSRVLSRHARAFDPYQEILYVYLAPVYVWLTLLLLFFLSAVNKLTPLFANRSTRLRLLYVGAIAGLLVLGLTAMHHDFVKEGPRDRASAIAAFAFILTLFTSLSLIFTCEDPVLPAALAAKIAATGRASSWRSILMPGSSSGAFFVLVVNIVALMIAGVSLLPLTTDFAAAFGQHWAGQPLAWAFLSIIAWIFYGAMLGLYLSATFRSRPTFQKAVFIIALLGQTMAPFVHFAVAETTPESLRVPGEGPFSLCLTPAAAIFSSLSAGQGHDFPTFFELFGYRVPFPPCFIVLCMIGGLAFRLLADRRLGAIQQGLLPLPAATTEART